MAGNVETTRPVLVVQDAMPGFGLTEAVFPEELAFLTQLPGIDPASRIMVAESLSLERRGAERSLPELNFRHLSAYQTLTDLYDHMIHRNFPDVVVIRTDSSVLKDLISGKREQERDLLRLLVLKLGGKVHSHEIRFWLVEDNGKSGPLSAEQKEQRLQLLREIGLVERKVTKDGKGLVISAGRPGKKAERPKRDYTGKPYVEPIKERIREELEERGWVVVSWEEALGKLRASSFPTADFKRLREGYGIIVRPSRCECLYRINNKGDVFLSYECTADNHDPLVKQEEAPLVIGYQMKMSAVCRECGNHLLLTLQRTGRSNRNGVEIESEVDCPHCRESVIDRRIFHTKKRIVEFEKEK